MEDNESFEEPDTEEVIAPSQRITRTQQAEMDAMLNSDPSLNPIFQKVAGRNLSLGGGIGMILRNQILSVYDAVETHEQVLTTSELKVKQETEREAVIAIERAKFAALKVTQGQKSRVTQGVRKSEMVVPPSEPRVEENQKVVDSVQEVKPKKKRKPVAAEERISVQPLQEITEEPRFISLWEMYADEGPPEGEVETESVTPRSYEFSGAKTYNVMVQVRPKDIANVVIGPDAVEVLAGRHAYKVITSTLKPKMMDVSFMVRPRDKEKELELPFKNASTQARPRGYKELDLGTPLSTHYEEKEVQVTELDIEKSNAANRSLILRDGNILWPNIMEFTTDLAEIKIKTYIRTFWKLDKEWMFDIRFIQTHTTNYRKKFIYEVTFSKPTNAFPVPRATASVFFIFESEHYNCPDQGMKVHYLLEGNRYPYTPGIVEFREEWLLGIIQNKLKIQKALNF